MKFLEKIFSIKNDDDRCYCIITIMGIKIKISRKIKRLEKKLQTLKPIGRYVALKQTTIIKEKIDFEIEKYKRRESMGINIPERDTKIIVSLTSFPDRIYEIKYAIFSLLNQSLKPDKVILWLAEEQFPNKDLDIPLDVLDLKKYGLTIAYTKDIRSYKKLIPTLNEHPNDIVISADDDIYYPSNWLELMYNEYLKDPNNVYAHRVHKIKFETKNKLKPYLCWDRLINDNSLSLLNFPSTGGGILFPPHILYKDCLREDIFTKLSPCSDEIWFWGMIILNRTKVKVVENAINIITVVNAERESIYYNNETILARENLSNGNTKNKQIQNMLDYYPELLNILQEANKQDRKQ